MRVRTVLIFLIVVLRGVFAYDTIDYWDRHYGKDNSAFQWLQDEHAINHLLRDFFARFFVHQHMSSILELGFGSSNMGVNVLCKSSDFGPGYLAKAPGILAISAVSPGIVDTAAESTVNSSVDSTNEIVTTDSVDDTQPKCVGDADSYRDDFRGVLNSMMMASHPVISGDGNGPKSECGRRSHNKVDTFLCRASGDPARTVLSVDFSKVAYENMLERHRIDPSREKSLILLHGEAYELLMRLKSLIDLPKEVREPKQESSLPLDFVFDSGAFDNFVISDVEKANKTVEVIYDVLHPDHGAWLSVSYNVPSFRLLYYRRASWARIIICRPKNGREHHLYWLLLGETWNTMPKGESFEAGKYTCADADRKMGKNEQDTFLDAT